MKARQVIFDEQGKPVMYALDVALQTPREALEALKHEALAIARAHLQAIYRNAGVRA